MGIHHFTSDYTLLAIPLVCLLVWAFNSYRLGKWKRTLPWVVGGLVILGVLALFLQMHT